MKLSLLKQKGEGWKNVLNEVETDRTSTVLVGAVRWLRTCFNLKPSCFANHLA